MSIPLVAIVTPTLNGARFLAETLESVQQQTWPNLVHVVLDNNSTDETATIIERFRGGRVPILYFRNDETLLQRDNWNKAFSHVPANATYVRLLCDDDTIYPTSVERMVELAEANPNVGVVASNHFCGGRIADLRWPVERQVFDGLEAIRMTLLRQGIMMVMQMLWRKSVVDRLEPIFTGDVLGGSFDVDTVFSLLELSDYGFVHECLGFTRVHENSVSSLVFSNNNRTWTRDALDFIVKHGKIAFGHDYSEQFARFRRYYVRRIVVWRRNDGGSDRLGIHKDAFKRAGLKLDRISVIDAFFDWALIRLKFRRNWEGFPGWE